MKRDERYVIMGSDKADMSLFIQYYKDQKKPSIWLQRGNLMKKVGAMSSDESVDETVSFLREMLEKAKEMNDDR